MIKVLATKQLSDEEFAFAQALNFDVRCVAFIEVIPVLWNENVLKDVEFDSVAFTSSNAVKHFLDNPNVSKWLIDKNVFSISGKTLLELQVHEIDVLAVADNAATLTEGVIEKHIVKSLLHVCGNRRLDTLERRLEQAAINYYPLEVYETRLVANKELKDDFDVILFFSPSGVDGFLASNKISAKTMYCCIGDTTAAKLKQLVPTSRVLVSPYPTSKAMFERVVTFFDLPLN